MADGPCYYLSCSTSPRLHIGTLFLHCWPPYGSKLMFMRSQFEFQDRKLDGHFFTLICCQICIIFVKTFFRLICFKICIFCEKTKKTNKRMAHLKKTFDCPHPMNEQLADPLQARSWSMIPCLYCHSFTPFVAIIIVTCNTLVIMSIGRVNSSSRKGIDVDKNWTKLPERIQFELCWIAMCLMGGRSQTWRDGIRLKQILWRFNLPNSNARQKIEKKYYSAHTKFKGRKEWWKSSQSPSVYGRRLTSKRLWVRIPTQDTGWTLFPYIVVIIVMFVSKDCK